MASSGDARRIDLRRSGPLAAYLLALHSLAIMVVLAAPWAWGWRLALLVAVTASLAHGWRNQVRCRAPDCIRTLEYGHGNRWLLTSRDGAVRAARLTGCFVHPWIVVLYLRLQGGGARALLLARGSAGSEQLRRLRVYLRTTGSVHPYRSEQDPPADWLPK